MADLLGHLVAFLWIAKDEKENHQGDTRLEDGEEGLFHAP